MIQLADSEGPDQTARMRRLIWAFSACIFSHVFAWRGPYVSVLEHQSPDQFAYLRNPLNQIITSTVGLER